MLYVPKRVTALFLGTGGHVVGEGASPWSLSTPRLDEAGRKQEQGLARPVLGPPAGLAAPLHRQHLALVRLAACHPRGA